jgi:hypothetical protein
MANMFEHRGNCVVFGDEAMSLLGIRQKAAWTHEELNKCFADLSDIALSFAVLDDFERFDFLRDEIDADGNVMDGMEEAFERFAKNKSVPSHSLRVVELVFSMQNSSHVLLMQNPDMHAGLD